MVSIRRSLLVLGLSTALCAVAISGCAAPAPPGGAASPQSGAEQDSRLEVAFAVREPSNGVTTTGDGRIFVVHPHADGSHGVQLGEIVGAAHEERPFPDAGWNAWTPDFHGETSHVFVHVNAARIGPDGALWAVDAGSADFAGTALPGGPKLVRIDLANRDAVRVYPLAGAFAPEGSYVDDVRFNGDSIYLTDAGRPGLIVLDKNTGEGRRVLDNDRSVTAERDSKFEGHVLVGRDGKPFRLHADQLEVSPDGKLLYESPLSGPLYKIPTEFLDNPAAPAQALAGGVIRFVDTGALGGTAIDADGDVYISDVDHGQILKAAPDGRVSVVVKDRRIIWPDALWISGDGYLWIPAAQIGRAAPYNGGQDRQQPPFQVLKINLGIKPSPIDHA